MQTIIIKYIKKKTVNSEQQFAPPKLKDRSLNSRIRLLGAREGHNQFGSCDRQSSHACRIRSPLLETRFIRTILLFTQIMMYDYEEPKRLRENLNCKTMINFAMSLQVIHLPVSSVKFGRIFLAIE